MGKLAKGTHALAASYVGDANYLAGMGTLSLIVA